MKKSIGPTAVQWRKSSHSNGGDGNCVEVADGFPEVVPVRDSKDPDGPVLIFTHEVWGAFVGGLKGSSRA
ncbi:DUF397 domain-containing protein [Streptomyces albofaciens JCM 4342]|uniref:DUF397 domain-containing protein n=1 Tax=Streptomyces albofaciens TaxID=66866 RepID=UPI001238FCB3|nr:DUF397 domain-containing protein [Streptomyces albofaciens]KAA6220889.1 DUF397 domain-containing protein [Streptomyces albofaciens JCM 4342]